MVACACNPAASDIYQSPFTLYKFRSRAICPFHSVPAVGDGLQSHHVNIGAHHRSLQHVAAG